MLSGLSQLFNRWRHGRGFGIHSPFAYRLITEVLHQEMGYYAYLRMPGDECYRTVFRIVLALRPMSVALVGADRYKRAVGEAMPGAVFVEPADAGLIIVDGGAEPSFGLEAYPDKHVIALDYRCLPSWKGYKESMPYGMTFANGGSMAVGVTLAHLPRQDFDVKF